MTPRKAKGPASAPTDDETRNCATGEPRHSSNAPLPNTQPIRAELCGGDQCTAAGICAQSSSPVLALCRALIEAGHDPGARLECYRGDTFCIVVRSIGEGAGLEINAYGTGFRPCRVADAAPPMRSNAPAGAGEGAP